MSGTDSGSEVEIVTEHRQRQQLLAVVRAPKDRSVVQRPGVARKLDPFSSGTDWQLPHRNAAPSVEQPQLGQRSHASRPQSEDGRLLEPVTSIQGTMDPRLEHQEDKPPKQEQLTPASLRKLRLAQAKALVIARRTSSPRTSEPGTAGTRWQSNSSCRSSLDWRSGRALSHAALEQGIDPADEPHQRHHGDFAVAPSRLQKLMQPLLPGIDETAVYSLVSELRTALKQSVLHSQHCSSQVAELQSELDRRASGSGKAKLDSQTRVGDRETARLRTCLAAAEEAAAEERRRLSMEASQARLFCRAQARQLADKEQICAELERGAHGAAAALEKLQRDNDALKRNAAELTHRLRATEDPGLDSQALFALKEELERCQCELAEAHAALQEARSAAAPVSPATQAFNPVYATETLERQVAELSELLDAERLESQQLRRQLDVLQIRPVLSKPGSAAYCRRSGSSSGPPRHADERQLQLLWDSLLSEGESEGDPGFNARAPGTAVPSRGLSVGEEDLRQRLQFAAANAAAHESSLQQSLEQQQQEAERLQLDNRVLCEQLQAVQERESELESQLAAANSKVTELESGLAASQASCRALVESSQEADALLHHFKAEAAETHAQLAECEAELGPLRALIDEAEAQLDGRREQLEQSTAKLTATTSRLLEREAEIGPLGRRLEAAELEVERCSEQLEASTAELAAARHETAVAREAQRQSAQALEAAEQRCALLADARKRAAEADSRAAARAEQLIVAEARRQQLEQEVAAAREEVDSLSSSLRDVSAELQLARESLSGARAAASEAESKAGQADLRRRHMERQLEESQQAAMRASRAAGEAEERAHELERRLGDANAKQAELELEARRCSAAAQVAGREVAVLRRQAGDSATGLAEAERRVRNAESDSARSRDSAAVANDSLRRKRAELEHVRGELAAAEAARKTAAAALVECQGQLADCHLKLRSRQQQAAVQPPASGCSEAASSVGSVDLHAEQLGEEAECDSCGPSSAGESPVKAAAVLNAVGIEHMLRSQNLLAVPIPTPISNIAAASARALTTPIAVPQSSAVPASREAWPKGAHWELISPRKGARIFVDIGCDYASSLPGLRSVGSQTEAESASMLKNAAASPLRVNPPSASFAHHSPEPRKGRHLAGTAEQKSSRGNLRNDDRLGAAAVSSSDATANTWQIRQRSAREGGHTISNLRADASQGESRPPRTHLDELLRNVRAAADSLSSISRGCASSGRGDTLQSSAHLSPKPAGGCVESLPRQQPSGIFHRLPSDRQAREDSCAVERTPRHQPVGDLARGVVGEQGLEEESGDTSPLQAILQKYGLTLEQRGRISLRTQAS